MSARPREPSASMAKAAMPLDELGQWLLSRPGRPPAATNLSMLDGYVTAIVVGPVSFDPREWIWPLLAIDADAFNHVGTPEFAAISAVAVRHNDISNILSTAPGRLEPIYRRKPNREVDARPMWRANDKANGGDANSLERRVQDLRIAPRVQRPSGMQGHHHH